jgi:hypothetical protein
MAYFKLIQFGGIAPQVSPRLLEDTLAQTASNVNLESQRLTPITDDAVVNPKADVTTLASANRQSIYKYADDQWLQFDEDVDVVPGPIAGDTNNTVYWTGQSFPRMGRSTNVIGGTVYPNAFFRLGIESPANTPAVAIKTPVSFDATVTTVNGSSVLTVTTASDHGAAVGEYVTLAGFATQNGVTADDINQTHKIATVPSTTTLTVEPAVAATGASTSSSIGDGATFKGLADQLPDYSTSYVYTFVSAYGEEGPPSAASTVITTDDNATITVSNLSTGPVKSNSNLDAGAGAVKRIYRSNTGSNTTAFQFVAEISMATASYDDTSNNDQLAEVIPSTYWIAPPDDDKSFTTLTASALIRGTFTDPDDGNAYLIIGNQIKQFQGGSTDQTYTWKSKEFTLPKPTGMSFVKIDAEAFPATVKVYGDGVLFYTGTIALSGTQHSVSGSYVNAAGSSVNISSTNISEPVLRLPPRIFTTYAVEVSSTKVINEIAIAESMDEIRGAYRQKYPEYY